MWNDLDVPAFDGVGLAGSKSRVNAFLLGSAVFFFSSSTVSLSLLSFYRLVLWGLGL